MSTSQNYALIDNASGYVWGVYSAESPESACAAATLDTGMETATYELAYQLASNEGGYLVYEAPAGFSVNDGQNANEIAAVAALPFIGKFRQNA